MLNSQKIKLANQNRLDTIHHRDQPMLENSMLVFFKLSSK